MVSVVIPTKNEETNLGACLDAFRGSGFEAVVVDNDSSDRTREIAAERGARVFVQGPERCAQRNRGWREAKGEWILFLDADMILSAAAVAEIAAVAAQPRTAESPAAYYIPEIRAGRGLRARARAFERGFYDATVIDGLRLIRREDLERVGGYDESLVACEDWDLDRRLLALGLRVASLKGSLTHNERQVSARRFLEKKAYYSASVARYREKWHNDAVCRKQFGLGYRYWGVFVENGKWKRILRHPILFAAMMAERVAVGFVYLRNR